MPDFRSMLVAAPLALAAVAAPAFADLAKPQPQPRASALDLAVAYDVVTIEGLAALTPGDRISVRLPLAGGAVDLDLEPHSVRSLDFMVYVQDEMGVRPVPAPAVRTYRGGISGLEGSEAFGSIIDGRFTGQFRVSPDAGWTIVEPLDEHDPKAARLDHIVIEQQDILDHGHVCGVDDAFLAAEAAGRGLPMLGGVPAAGAADAGHVHGPDCNHAVAELGTTGGTPAVTPGIGTQAPATKAGRRTVTTSEGAVIEVTDIVIDADYQFFLANGGSVTNTVLDIENVMNGVAFVYERDVDLTYEITGILVRSSAGANPYTTSDAAALLGQFQGVWNGGSLNTVRRDTAHLFTGRELIGSTIGIAFNGVICEQGFAYGLSQSRFNTFYDARVSLTAHEIGHNYNAGHCSGGNCYIMCASVNGCGGTYGPNLKFGVVSQNSIENFANSRTCLSNQAGVLFAPFEDDFEGVLAPNPTLWSWYVDTVVTTNLPFSPPSGTRAAELRSFNDIPFRQGDLRSAVIDLSGQSDFVLEFQAARSGVEAGEGLRVEYRAFNDRWNELFFLPSDGSDQDFIAFTLPLPPQAYHDEFRIRFRLDGNDFTDRVYLDDIRIGDVDQPEPCPGDSDGNGAVDFDDLLAVLALFGPCPAPCSADFNGNGEVDFDDLLTVLAAYGPCP